MPATHHNLTISKGVEYLYGTAGFRMRADLMEPVAYRLGIMAAALSCHYDGQIIGVMLTASHNPAEDNGIKLVAPDGGLLPSSWEAVAESIANCPMEDLDAEVGRHFGSMGRRLGVAIGRDTRPSGEHLEELVALGAGRMGASVIRVGLVTTPEFHSDIRRLNRSHKIIESEELEEDYLNGLISSFSTLTNGGPSNTHLVVDCSNGVGAIKMGRLMLELSKMNIKVELVNCGDSGILNEGCGADFVKTQVKPPLSITPMKGEVHFASLDGDADRLVYFNYPSEGQFTLIDGDKIGVLVAMTMKRLLDDAGLLDTLSIGVVQTAYANGASSKYIRERLTLPVCVTSTGVKHLHKAAEENFDIGIYFEANGHGTVLFSKKARATLRSTHNKAAECLLATSRLASQLVGDGIADLLLVEGMLKISGMTINSWSQMYADLPSVLAKMEVKDRTRLKTTNADQTIVEPVGLQDALDKIVREVPGGRCFARPSGTEDVVRIYAEAASSTAAQQLTDQVISIINQYL